MGNNKVYIEEIFSRYYTSLVIYANRFLRDRELAEDVVQDVFVRLMELNHDKEKLTPSYLYRCVHNKAIDIATAKKITISLTEEANIKSPTFDIEEELRRTNMLKDMYDAIESLPPACAAIFKEVYLKKRRYEDVAKDMNISLSSVKTQMFRAMKQLREVLNTIIFA